MNKVKALSLLFLIVLSAAGCESTGISMRERGSFNYSNFVYGLYDRKDSKVESDFKEIHRPLKVAVAQVGETAPPKIVIDKLRAQPELFSKVVPLPLGGEQSGSYYNQTPSVDLNDFQEKMGKMRLLAKDLGVDYIFLFGGSADYGTSPTVFQILDWTIVGAYIFPVNKVTAEGRAAGALIDIDTGRVVCMVNSEAKKQQHVTTIQAYSAQDQVVIRLRDDLVSSLSDELIDKAHTL